MKHYYFILIISILVTFSSCSDKENSFKEDKLTFSEQFKVTVGALTLLKIKKDTLLTSSEILSYYSDCNFDPLWVTDSSLTKNGAAMYNLVENAHQYGLLPEFFYYQTLKSSVKDSSFIETELLLSNSFLLYISHLNVGFIDTISMQYTWKKDSISFDLIDQLKLVKETKDVTKFVESFQPKNWEYVQLQKGLSTFIKQYKLDTNHFIIPSFKEDSAISYTASKAALIAYNFIDSTSNDSIYVSRLKDFQILNAITDDAIVGRWTSRALAKSNMDRFFKAMLSLEKWRWKKQNEFPDRYVRINIPAYTLKLWNKKEVIRKHKMICGAYTTQTPEFQATLKRFVTNPFWYLPYSIASTESLAGIKKDSSYFSKKGIKLFSEKIEIDPNTVNWNEVNNINFRYELRQDGGESNSLGRVKFLFPNSHAVYFHDTPSKYLFRKDIRAYSHGCIRLHNPFDFAKTLLELDKQELTPQEFDTLIVNGIQQIIELNTRFEVYIEYYTATSDSSGTITFHPDIYDRDELYLKGIKTKFNY